jgi:hypothetical protein
MQNKPSVIGKNYHKSYGDNMLILQGLSRLILRQEKPEKDYESEWGSGGRRFKSSRPDQELIKKGKLAAMS